MCFGDIVIGKYIKNLRELVMGGFVIPHRKKELFQFAHLLPVNVLLCQHIVQVKKHCQSTMYVQRNILSSMKEDQNIIETIPYKRNPHPAHLRYTFAYPLGNRLSGMQLLTIAND